MENVSAPAPMNANERKARMLALFESMFPPNASLLRKKIRILISNFTEDIAVFTEKLLVLMKKHNFSLCAHENLRRICEGFGPYCATNLNQNEDCMIYFKNLVDEWRCSGMEASDNYIINNHDEEFNFINL